MPITKSAKKSLKVSRTKRVHNLLIEKKLKKALKKVDEKNVNEVISLIDKAAKKNLIHKNKAARLKSRINKKFGSPKKVKKAVPAPKTAPKTSAKKIVKPISKKPSIKPKTSPK